MLVFLFPFSSKAYQGMLSSVFIGSRINFLQVGTKHLTILPNHVFATVADLVHNAELGNRLRKNAFNSFCKAFEVIGAGNKDILYAPRFQVC